MGIGNITQPVLRAFVESGMSDDVLFVDICVYNPSFTVSLGADLVDRGNPIDRIVSTRGRTRCVGCLTTNEHLRSDSVGMNLITYTMMTRQMRIPLASPYAMTFSLSISIASRIL